MNNNDFTPFACDRGLTVGAERSATAIMRRFTLTVLGALALTVVSTANAQSVIPEMTYIGGAGNAADTAVMRDGTTGYGAVNYDYYVGTTEVTNAQYAAFLNSVAKNDTNGLYNAQMEDYGIIRSGTAGSYVYSITNGLGQRPVVFVSFINAARYCNWLTNGASTSASTETGMYTITADGLFTRNADAWAAGGYAITSEDEWYKAAYYNVADGGYTLYATGNTIDQNLANYYVTLSPYNLGHTADTGSYAAEQNGTYDMTGNAFEWTEAVQKGAFRTLRGGSFTSNDFGLESLVRTYYYSPDYESLIVGFRVSSLGVVPEPTAYASILGALVLGASVWRRKRRSI